MAQHIFKDIHKYLHHIELEFSLSNYIQDIYCIVYLCKTALVM